MKHRCLYILPECYVDTNLIEYLVNAGVNHQHSCTKVVGLLNSVFKDQFAIGIIDRDKVQVGYISECDVIAATPHLTLLKHRTRAQFLITISPAVDRFILDSAAAEGVSPETCSLPSALNAFTAISKSVTSNTDDRFRKLFKALRNTREFRNLRESLVYMGQNRYLTDVNVLRSLFEAP